MVWKLSLPEPQMLVYYFVKLIGLAPFTVKRNRLCPPTFVDVLYPVLVIASHLVFTLRTLTPEVLYFGVNHYFGLAGVAMILKNLETFPSTFLTLIVFTSMNKNIVYIVNKLCIVGDEFRNLGILEDHEIFFKNILATTAVANVFMTIMCVALCYLEVNWHVYFSIKSGFEYWSIFNTVLIFAQLLLCIRKRFTLLNRKFHDMFPPTPYVGSSHGLRMHLGGRNPRNQVLMDLGRFQMIEGLHLDLCDLVDQTTHLFTIPVIFITLTFLINLSSTSFWVYYVVRTSSQPSSFAEIVPILIDNFPATTLRTIILIVELFTIAHVSATTYEEGNGIKTVLGKVWNNSTPRDLKDEFFTFYLQLMHQSASVSILGFFDLYYSYACRVLSAVAGYTIVMIQFGKPDPQSGA